MVGLSSQQTGVGVMLRNLVGLCVGSRSEVAHLAQPDAPLFGIQQSNDGKVVIFGVVCRCASLAVS